MQRPFAKVLSATLLCLLGVSGVASAQARLRMNDLQVGADCSVAVAGEFSIEKDAIVSHFRTSGVLALLDPNGRLTPGFGTQGVQAYPLGSYASVRSMVQRQEALIFAGHADAYQPLIGSVDRTTGSLNRGFGGGLRVTTDVHRGLDHLFPVTDGYYAVSKSKDCSLPIQVRKLGLTGYPDESFGANGILEIPTSQISCAVVDAAIDDQERLVLSGTASLDTPDLLTRVIRITADGRFDESFGAYGVRLVTGRDAPNASDFRSMVVVERKVYLAFQGVDPSNGRRIDLLVRLTDDGSADATFGVNGSRRVSLPLGSMVSHGTKIYGYGSDQSGRGWVMRMERDGSLDRSFAATGSQTIHWADFQASGKLEVCPNGEVLIPLYNDRFSDTPDTGIIKLTADGAFDPSFGANGFVTFSYADLFPR